MPTSYWAPERPRLASRPMWLEAQIVLPTIDLAPVERGTGWSLRLMEGGAGKWWYAHAATWDELMYILTLWRDDPERALKEIWGAEPPRGAYRTGVGASGGAKAPPGPSAPPPTTSADDLDF